MLPGVSPFSPLAALGPLAVVAALVLAGCTGGGDAAQQPASSAEPAAAATGAEPSPDAAAGGSATEESSEDATAEAGTADSGPSSDSTLSPSAVPTVPARGTPTELQPSEPFGLSSVILRGPGGREVEVPVYVAATREQRARGLMDRDSLPADTGMIFLFPSDSSGAFYMYRTRIPLSIAFFSADGRAVSVLDMEPCGEQEPGRCPLYPPGATYRTALEVNQGYFAELGLDEGWTLDLPEDLPAAS